MPIIIPAPTLPVVPAIALPSNRELQPGNSYIFELADSRTRDRIGELTRAKDRQLVLALNKAGALTFGLPLKDDLSLLVEEVATCVRVKRRLDSGSYKVEWEGPVWTVDEETPDTLSIGCVGWMQMLEKRLTKPVGQFGWDTLAYAEMDAGAIVLDLLRQTNADPTSSFNYVEVGDYESTQPRTETFQPWASLLNVIQNFSELEAGYDFAVDSVTRLLNIYERIREIRPDVIFEYGSNVLKARRASDSSKICNRMIAYSAIGYAVAEDPASIAEFDLFEEAVSLSDVRDIAILQAYANAEVAIRSTPLRLSSFEPRKASSARPEDPRIFSHFNVGDVVFQNVDRGRLSIAKQTHRIFGLTVTWDTAGMEQISSLQTTAS